jgi:glycosyltransferase involved in cell wall biosynthesis
LHLANSKAQQRFLLDYSLLPSDRVALMANSIDCERFCPGDQAAARSLTCLAPTASGYARLPRRVPRNVAQRIKVTHEVVRARPAARIGFVYVGDGDLVTEWKQQAAALGLGDCVVFAGRQNDVVPYYRSADLLVHAAKFESFGLAVVEAMAAACPSLPVPRPAPGKPSSMVQPANSSISTISTASTASRAVSCVMSMILR